MEIEVAAILSLPDHEFMTMEGSEKWQSVTIADLINLVRPKVHSTK